MPKLPTVAIIGKPNTGKSTLFNRMVGRRKAIVSDTAGTTRDHVASRVEAKIDYLLVDTGGMGGGTEDNDLEDDVHRQSLLALENADVILFTISSREELTSNDHAVIDLLRKNKKQHVPVILVITKCDNPQETEAKLPEYYALGVTENVIPISAPHKMGIDDLEDAIIAALKELNFVAQPKEDAGQMPQIAVIGKPNAGKSSLINAFMSETQRQQSPLLVSDIPGTTRDTTDTVIKYHEKEYSFMDTAGIKQRKQTNTEIETYAYFRSVRAVEMCDITILVLDATVPISKQDKRIAGMATEEGKGMIIVANKWDLVDKEDREQVMQTLQHELQFCRFAPILPCSAESREGLLKLFDLIEMVQRNRTRRIATKDLHRWFEDTVYGQPMGQLLKTKHLTQADEIPPTFVMFVRDPKKIQVSQLRFLDNRLRETFDFDGTPVRWITK